jgi:RNA polymerase sigma-70 factor, ECF subfamily
MPSAAESRCNAFLAEHAIVIRAASTRVCPRGLGLGVDELEQDIRVRLWRTLESERQITDPASYIYRIAATAAIDAVRRVKARREQPLPEERVLDYSGPDGPVPAENLGTSPESIAGGREVARKVGAALGRIAESRRKPVRLHLQGFTSEEIARLLDFTEAKARNLVYRGLEELRRELRSEGIEHEAG